MYIVLKTNQTHQAKYFLIKDYYYAGEIDVEFCPTNDMWADVLTKLLQGQKFRNMHAFLQNCPRDYNDDVEFQLSMKAQDVASLRECVDEHAKLKTNRGDAHNITRDPQNITFSQPRATSPTCVSRVTWGQVTSIPQVSSVSEHKIKHVSNDMKSTGE